MDSPGPLPEPANPQVTRRRVGQYLLRHWWPGAVCLGIGAGVLALFLIYAPKTERISQDLPASADIGGAWAVVAVVAVLGAVMGLYLLVKFGEQRPWDHPVQRDRMITELTQALTKALSAVDRIKCEVEEGNALVQRLEQEKEVKGRLAKLSREDAQAVLSQMEEVARNASGRSTVVQVVWNFFFFIAGVVVSYFLTRPAR